MSTVTGAGSMTTLQSKLAQAKASGRAAFVGYLPVGFPDVPTSIEAMKAMAAAGADIIEIGVPYSDPGMDGPTIQAAVEPAVRAGVGMRDVLAAVEAVAASGAAPVVMSYWNPIEHYGVRRFATDLAAAGGSGAITPDLIPDEAQPWLAASDEFGLDRVFLVAPSSTDARLKMTTSYCRGFVYVASTMGVTGVRDAVNDAAQTLVARTRAVTDLPVCVGLGVSTPEQAREIAAFADGVIVGSALVRQLLDSPDTAGVRAVGELTAHLCGGLAG